MRCFLRIHCFMIFFFFISLLKSLRIENDIAIRTKVRGNALTIIAVCIAFNPPENIKTIADADKKNHKTTFTIFGGFKLPLVVCIPKTNVAESADVHSYIFKNLA